MFRSCQPTQVLFALAAPRSRNPILSLFRKGAAMPGIRRVLIAVLMLLSLGMLMGSETFCFFFGT
jgi:hypothetical protein